MTTLVFSWKRPLLSANQRLHWRKKADLTKAIRETTFWKARHLGPSEHVTVQMVWVVADRRRRDEDNLYPTFKAMCDGLVDAGVVPDDTPQWMTKLGPLIRMGDQAHVELVIT